MPLIWVYSYLQDSKVENSRMKKLWDVLCFAIVLPFLFRYVRLCMWPVVLYKISFVFGIQEECLPELKNI